MRISEQVKELREFGCFGTVKQAMLEAADTIEVLCAKLADMERSAEDCGGKWISCKERLPEEDNDFIVTFRDGECVIAYLDDNDKWINSSTGSEISFLVVAWQPLPKPYHDPQQIHHQRQRTPQAMPGSERDRKDRGK